MGRGRRWPLLCEVGLEWGLRGKAILCPENVLRPVHPAGPLCVRGALSNRGKATGDTSMGPNICGGRGRDATLNRAPRWRPLETTSEWWASSRRQRDRPAVQGYGISPVGLLLGHCRGLAMTPSPLASSTVGHVLPTAGDVLEARAVCTDYPGLAVTREKETPGGSSHCMWVCIPSPSHSPAEHPPTHPASLCSHWLPGLWRRGQEHGAELMGSHL